MFEYQQIKNMNETEGRIARIIFANADKIPYMTIRELAKETLVSTATLLRFLNKAGYSSYNEFKNDFKLKKTDLNKKTEAASDADIQLFFDVANSASFDEKIEEACKIIESSDILLVIGVGPSGAFAKYCARYFADLGFFAVGLSDSYYPFKKFKLKNAAILAISESGESSELLSMIAEFQSEKHRILSITSTPHSTLSKVSDWNFSYNMNFSKKEGHNTQIPALFVIETIAKKLQK